jgi:HNH endonuclease/AP2 domain
VDIVAQQRFWEKVDTSAGPDGCWEWLASRARGGYGQFRLGRRMPRAHRLAYELATGERLGDRQAQQICRNRACVNPAHIRPATQKQNSEHRLAPRSDTSGVRGVSWHKQRRAWRAKVGHHGVAIHVGYFDTVAEAERAVRAKRLELFTHNDADRVSA